MKALKYRGSKDVRVNCWGPSSRATSLEVIITHRMKLEDAARGYRIFNDKEEDCRKVVPTP